MKSILILLALALAPLHAQGQGISFSAPTTVSVTTSSALAYAANGKRVYLIMSNIGSTSVIVKFGSIQSGSEGITIPAGGSYEPIHAPVNSVYAKSASSTDSLVIIEGVPTP